MATTKSIRTPSKSSARTRLRVEDSEKKTKVRKAATHRGQAEVSDLGDGFIEIVGQASELLPVGQFANVTIGPVSIRARVNVGDLSSLVDFDFNDTQGFDYASLTKDQQALSDRIENAASAVQAIAERVVARDRAVVEESVRLANVREAEKEKTRTTKR